MAYFAALRAESGSSASSYDTAISTVLGAEDPALDDEFNFYFRLRLNLAAINRYDEKRLASALAQDARLPVIDRYLLLVRMLQVMVSDSLGGRICSLAGEVGNRLLDRIDDPRLLSISAMGGSLPKRGWGNVGTSFLACIDDYTRGAYGDATVGSLAEIAKSPEMFLPYELLGRSVLHSRAGNFSGIGLSGHCRRLAELVCGVLERGAVAEESLSQILKFSYRFDHLRIGSELFAFYLKNRLPRHPLLGEQLALASSALPTPRMALCLPSPEAARELISRLEEVSKDSCTVQLFREIITQIAEGEPAPFSMSMPGERQLKYEALVLERCGRHADAREVYGRLKNLPSGVPMVQMDAAVGLYNCLLEMGQLDECIRLVVDTFIGQDNLLAPTQVSELVRRSAEAPALQSVADPAFPILHYMQKREGARSTGDVDPLYVAYDRFLSEHNARRPTDLKDRLGDFDPERLRFFLRYICVPDTMDSSIAYESTEDLEQERIAVCQVLRTLDTENEDRYADEISDLQKRAAIRSALRSADQSKIFVDVAGVRGGLKAQLLETFERFRAVSSLHPDHRRLLPEKLVKKAMRLNDESLELLRQLFDEILFRFVFSDEYGLDSYLSVKVRHGTLAGQIRNEFERYHLVTRKDSASGSYEPNEYWTSKLEIGGIYHEFLLDQAFSRFSDAVDSTIEEVKSKWVQIRSADIPDGYFDYDFDRAFLMALQVSTAGVEEFDAFVDAVLQHLWQRTEANLSRLRAGIVGPLGRRLREALERLRTELEGTGPPGLLADITSCSTAVQNVLQVISEWFVVSGEGAADDFDVGIAVESAVEIVRKTFPMDCGDMSAEWVEAIKLRGRTFSHFLDLLYILLENVIRHSRPGKGAAQVSVSRRGNRLCIEVKNPLPSWMNAEDLRSQLPEYEGRARERSRDVVRREGGSGFYKLGKILEHDLRASDWTFSLQVTDEAEFCGSLEMDLAGIAV